MISIVIPAYNYGQYLPFAIDSALAQGIDEIEILIGDDASTDNTPDIAQCYAASDMRIHHHRNPKNIGATANCNQLIGMAQGEYVLLLGADDYLLPGALKILKEALDTHTDCEFAYGRYRAQEELGQTVTVQLPGWLENNYYGTRDEFAPLLMFDPYILLGSTLFRKSVLQWRGMLFDHSLRAFPDEAFFRASDWDLMLNLSLNNKRGVFLNQQVSVFRVHRHQSSGMKKYISTGLAITEHLQLLDRYLTEDNLPRLCGHLEPIFKLLQEHYQFYIEHAKPSHSNIDRAIHQRFDEFKQRFKLHFETETDYLHRLVAHHPRAIDVAILTERTEYPHRRRPLFTLCIKTPSSQSEMLAATLQSLQQQPYPYWHLIVLADYTAPDSMSVHTDWLSWLKVRTLEDIETSTSTLNSVLADKPGDWIALLPPGTEFTLDCLLRLADTLQNSESLQAVYTDHNQWLSSGGDAEPQFKPDFNLAYLLSWDYIGAACWFNQRAVRHLGGFAPFSGKQSYELLLRIVDHYGEHTVTHVPYPLLHLPQKQEDTAAHTAQRLATEEHWGRIQRMGQVDSGGLPGIFKVSYPLVSTPQVSIIISNRDQLESLQLCIETLLTKTHYNHFEILIIDNQSRDPKVLNYYRQIQIQHPSRIRVLEYEAPFNLSGKCNLGAHQAHGDYLLFLHNDIEIVQAEWLERMLMHAQQPEIGVVGAKLIYPDTGMVQHGGIALGNGPKLLDLAHHYGQECRLDDAGYMNRLQCDLTLSAMSGACMLMRREVYTQVGGFNEALSGPLNDIEFCLRVGQAGLKVFWTPHAVLVHRYGVNPQSCFYAPIKQRAPAECNQRESEFLLTHWMPQLANDPSYNRNLTLSGPPLTLDRSISFGWDPSFSERPKILATAVAGARGEYRVVQPLSALSDAHLAQTCCMPLINHQLPKPLEIARLDPDSLVLHNGIDALYQNALHYYKKYFPQKRRIVTIDDLTPEIPAQHQEINANLHQAVQRLSLVDRLIVPTEALAEWARGWIDDIHIVPNHLPKATWWRLPTRHRTSTKPRVGWVGMKRQDLEILHPVIRATAHQVDWVFMGQWPEGLDDHIKEKHRWVPYSRYPKTMAGLNLDLAVAPLEINAFNESKSNLRLLEYGAMGWPVVCSDILPYQTDNAPVKRVPNTPQAWIEAILERVHDLDTAYREGDTLRDWVGQHHLLEDHLDPWLAAYCH